MSFDLTLLGSKLTRLREQFQLSVEEIATATGISADLLRAYEVGSQQPSGDEILILADFYKCDFKFFISNEKLASFEQTEMLFRRHGDQLTKADRWSIQEFLFLCECEHDLMDMLGRKPQTAFEFHPKGNYFKAHGESAATELRKALGYKPEMLTSDNIFQDLRKIGLHIFRRKLQNSNISGLFIKHPIVDRCVLVNYNEDVYRQRFSAAHEAGHAILDGESEFHVSFENDDHRKLIEIRANTFASRLLLPPQMLRKKIPLTTYWNDEQVINISNQFQVNPVTLAIALKEAKIITEEVFHRIKTVKLPRQSKSDPELGSDLSPNSLQRRKELLQRGLSAYYVSLCFDAYVQRRITTGRLAEMLLVQEHELADIAHLYQQEIL